MADRHLDLKGLKCPWPILKTGKLMKELDAGATIEVLATDAGAVQDFEDYCEVTGHQLVESDVSSDVYRFVLRKVER
ncbi:MAG: sulfurtransferase TusA family protein [Methyloligellaceae bacterium]